MKYNWIFKLFSESDKHIWEIKSYIFQSLWYWWYGKSNLHFKLYVLQIKIQLIFYWGVSFFWNGCNFFTRWQISCILMYYWEILEVFLLFAHTPSYCTRTCSFIDDFIFSIHNQRCRHILTLFKCISEES